MLAIYLIKIICVFIFTTPLWVTSALAVYFDDCNQHFYAFTEPDYIEPKLLNQSVPLCFNGFATLYSGITRTPIWSAEHLTRERLYQADTLPRDDSFHSESRLPSRMRASTSDYSRTGYDRGHLAPNADMSTIAQQYDSFSLANIVPQAPQHNRYLWRDLESITRYLTKKHGEVYVITGAAFKGEKIIQLNNKVLVPTHLFKAIYIPKIEQAAVYYAPNDDTGRIEIISLDELALRSGVDAFPATNIKVKSTAHTLPTSVGEITNNKNSGDTSNSESSNNSSDAETLMLKMIINVLKWLSDILFNRFF